MLKMSPIIKRIVIPVMLGLIVVLVVGAAAALYLIMHRVKGDYFEANGIRIHYTDEGKGEPVVLLHGFAVNADLAWRRRGITQTLAKDFRIIAMDLRGHGLSGKPHDSKQYGIMMVNDVVHLLDHLHIEKAHVVGYSLGGFITLKLASTHPERLFTASPLGAGWERPDNSAFLDALVQLADTLESGHGIEPLGGYLDADREKPGRLHTWGVLFMTRYFNDHLALAAMLKTLPDLGLTEEQVRRIPIPVCSIVGSRDLFKVSVDAMDGIVADHTVTVIDDADHVQTPLRPEMLDALERFLHEHGP